MFSCISDSFYFYVNGTIDLISFEYFSTNGIVLCRHYSKTRSLARQNGAAP